MVTVPQPFSAKIAGRSNPPVCVTALHPATASGIISSAAGRANRNASISVPSMPAKRPMGSSRCVSRSKTLIPPISTAPDSQISAPAGAAAETARPRTKIVRSNTERTMTRPTCGIRYGGSSSVNDDGVPRRRVTERNFDISRVMPTQSRRTPTIAAADAVRLSPRQVSAARRAGKRPLQGTSELVRMAIRRSRGESMMRHPVTPAALHPRPINIVRLCLPHDPQQAKHRSSENATRGR